VTTPEWQRRAWCVYVTLPYTYIYICLCIYMYIHSFMHTNVLLYLCTNVHLYLYVHIYNIQLCAYVRIHTYIHTYIHMYIHTFIGVSAIDHTFISQRHDAMQRSSPRFANLVENFLFSKMKSEICSIFFEILFEQCSRASCGFLLRLPLSFKILKVCGVPKKNIACFEYPRIIIST